MQTSVTAEPTEEVSPPKPKTKGIKRKMKKKFLAVNMDPTKLSPAEDGKFSIFYLSEKNFNCK